MNPGKRILEYLIYYKISLPKFAILLGKDYLYVDKLINNKIKITPFLANRLSSIFKKYDKEFMISFAHYPDYWLGQQELHDEMKKILKKI